MEVWRRDARREPIIVDLDTLVPKDHLLRKIEKVMDYEWLYERLAPYYCHDNGRPGTESVVLIKRVFTTHIRQESLDIVEGMRKTDLGKKFYAQRKKPLNGSLRMRRRNTPCVIHIAEAWPPSPDGSDLNLLP